MIDSPEPEPEQTPASRTAKSDGQLNAFICGEIPLTYEDGTEHWFDLEANRTYTLHEISLIMGVTRERVRQIQQKGLRKLYAKLASMARVEGENPVDWFAQVFRELDARKGGGHEYEQA